MNNILKYVYLRLFALTLGRSYRNSPDNACDDAIMLTGVVLVVPFVFVFTGVAVFFPYVGTHIVGVVSMIIVLLLVVPLMYSVNRRFTVYRRNPLAAAPYGTRTQRLTTFAVLLGFLATAPVAFGLFFRALLH